MIAADAESMKKTVKSLAEHRLPRWDELPDLDIYMDQVISLISRYFAGYPGFDDRILTSSMVNNYVKQGIIPSPVNKKYNRVHLAHLIIVCILKSVMPISLVGQLISAKVGNEETYESLYNRFCEYFDSSVAAVAKSMEDHVTAKTDCTDMVILSALRSHAEQTVAMGLMKCMTAEN